MIGQAKLFKTKSSCSATRQSLIPVSKMLINLQETWSSSRGDTLRNRLACPPQIHPRITSNTDEL